MRIGIDIRSLAEGSRTGVEEYLINLLENIFKLDKDNEYILFFNSFKKPDIDFNWAVKYPNVRIKKFRIPNKILNFFIWYFKYPKLDKLIGGVDVFFCPNVSFIAVSKNAKLVLTIHDLSYIRHPQFFSLKRRLWHWVINPRALCRRADKIIAVSDSTARDITTLFGIEPAKITKIYSGIGEKFEMVDRNDFRLIEIKDLYKLPFNFILYFGTIEPRKNIICLIQAFNRLKLLKNPDLDKFKLVLAGQRGWKCREIFRRIKDSPFSEDIILTGFVREEDKPYLYNLAAVLAYPSFFEGFGFPPLEAMASGVPVVTSNNSSLPEVTGNAAIMVDPWKPDETYRALKMLLSDRDLRNKLKELGLKQASNFSWEKTAKETLDIISGLIVPPLKKGE